MSNQMLRAGCAVAALAVLAGAAPAQAQQAPTVFVGAALGPGDGTSSKADEAQTTALTFVRDGADLRVRVGFAAACRNAPSSADDVLLRIPVDADGHFSGSRRLSSYEFGRVNVRVEGTLTDAGGTGVVRAFSIDNTKGCDTKDRSFVARPVDPAARPAAGGALPGGTLLLGVTAQHASVPYPFVARLSADGTTIERGLVVIAERGIAHDHGKRERYSTDVEAQFGGTIAGATFRYHRADRGRHGSGTLTFDGTVSAGGIAGRVKDVETYHETGYRERNSASTSFVAFPAT